MRFSFRFAAASHKVAELVFRRALPVDNVVQSPRILVQIKLQFSVLVDKELGGWIQHAGTLALVLVIDVDLASGKVKALRLRIRISFSERDLAVGDELDGAAGRGWNHADEAYVITQRAGNLDAAHRFHF